MEETLLRACHDNPADDTPRLVLADWLDEHGQPQRAELLRLTLALRREPDDPRRPARERRLQELLAAGVRPCVPLLTNSVGMDLALIPPGRFLMGSPDDEKERGRDEGPQRETAITRPFYLGVYPVTQRHYQAVVGSNPAHFQDDLDHPVEQVNWSDAVAFCQLLSGLPAEKEAGRQYRLPTEAEWEYACRAGTTTAYSFGTTMSGRDGTCNSLHPYGEVPSLDALDRTSKVGSYRPNAWGLYDLHGNVWEWCSDFYHSRYYLRRRAQRNPRGPAQGDRRVLRGGSWGAHAQYCRSACRNKYTPSTRWHNYGFRVACSEVRGP
jgi:uncharacterized protein (TIGR02996 family)